jgi:hypothetical protein
LALGVTRLRDFPQLLLQLVLEPLLLLGRHLAVRLAVRLPGVVRVVRRVGGAALGFGGLLVEVLEEERSRAATAVACRMPWGTKTTRLNYFLLSKIFQKAWASTTGHLIPQKRSFSFSRNQNIVLSSVLTSHFSVSHTGTKWDTDYR